MSLLSKLLPAKVKNCIVNIAAGAINKEPVEYVVKTEDTKKLQGKRIIVTGATGAIGSAVTYRLLAEGAIVGVCGRDMKKVDELIKKSASEISYEVGHAIPLYLDVTDDSSVENAINEFVDKTGGLDAFINNAGGGARGESKLIHEQSVEVIDRVLAVNLRGTIIASRKAAQVMTTQKQGVIINMASVVGMNGKAKMSDYAASKAGIIGFTRSLAIELGAYNIRVNCVSPGMVNQIPFDGGIPDRDTSKNCFGRMGYTDEVATVVAFILSEDSKYITGQNFVVDGGRSLGLMGD